MSADAAAVEGADDALDLGEGDAVIFESDNCEGCFLPDGTGRQMWRRKRRKVQNMTRALDAWT